MASIPQQLSHDKALISRITHRDNVPWILRHGLHANSSATRDPGFVTIGNNDLITKRQSREVPLPPGGTLDDYIPFYFTPCSVMLYNLVTGWGVEQRGPDEIVVIVSSLVRLDQLKLKYLFATSHASPVTAQYFDDRSKLDKVDYGLLQLKDFRDDPEDPSKKDRYQAEALVWSSMPTAGILGLACYTQSVQESLERDIFAAGANLKAVTRPAWYFQ